MTHSTHRFARLGLLAAALTSLTAASAGTPVEAGAIDEREALLRTGCNVLSESPANSHRAIELLKAFDYRSLSGDRLSGFAICAALAGDHRLAIVAWSQYIESTPQPYYAHQSRARSYLALGQTDAAISDLTASIARELGGEDDLLLLSKIYADRGDNLTVLKLLESEKGNIETLDPRGEPKNGVGSFSPREERLVMSLAAAYLNLSNVAAACSTLEWGFKRNNLSQKIFDALIPCLQENKKTKAVETYLESGCSNPVVAMSPYCKAGYKE